MSKPPTEALIADCEERLLVAMLASDVDDLDALLADELVFANHQGLVLTKADDLEAHRSGAVELEAITPTEQRIVLLEAAAVVSVRTEITAVVGGARETFALRFMRVWRPDAEGRWQVVAAQATGC